MARILKEKLVIIYNVIHHHMILPRKLHQRRQSWAEVCKFVQNNIVATFSLG